MHALHQEILPASGVEFATSLKLTPSTVNNDGQISARHEFVARVLCNVVVARSSLLRIFEVREEPAPIDLKAESDREREKERRNKSRRGTEAVEGEVEMDRDGDGYINIAKSISQKTPIHINTVTRFYLVREHRLHGVITGMEGIKTVSSREDHLDRLLVSFKDAKIALLEWSDATHDLVTVSIHTYERAPQLLALDSPLFRAELRVDPLSRCAALTLPKHALAILPFYQTIADLDVTEQEQGQSRDVPYSPSFILDLPAQVDPNVRNVIDFVFLPGFNNPTMAILYQTDQTWVGRLKEFKDTVRLTIFTLDIVAQNYPIIASVEGLPHDCLNLIACSTSLGGVVITTSNGLIYVDQSSKRVGLALNGWAARISDLSYPPVGPNDLNRVMNLEGSRSLFVDDKTFFLITDEGTVYPVEVVVDGKTVSKLMMGPPLAQSSVPSVVRNLGDDHIFIGSTIGPSVLVKALHVEEEISESDDMDVVPSAAVVSDMMDYDDDDDLYGTSKQDEAPSNAATSNGIVAPKKTKTVIHLSLKDYLPAYGPITSLTFSLAKNGERHVPELVASTGAKNMGGFTLFQRDLPTQVKRELRAIGGARGLWSLPIRQPLKSSGISYERSSNTGQAEDTLVFSTDVNPAPGLSRIATKLAKTEISISMRIPGTTIGVAPFFQRTAILHVTTNTIRLLRPDGTEQKIIRDMDGDVPRPKIRACSIADPFVLIFREDDSIGLFVGEMEQGKIRRKDMVPMGEKGSKYLAGCFYDDTTRMFEKQFKSAAPLAETAVNTANKSQWLLLVRPQGIMEVWTLPKLHLAFSTDGLPSLQNVLSDSHAPPALSLPQNPPRKTEDQDVEQLLLAPIGEHLPRPHLCVFLRSGQLTVYEVVPAGPVTDPVEKPRACHLKLLFVKVSSMAFEINRLPSDAQNAEAGSANGSAPPEKGSTPAPTHTISSSILAEQKKVLRLFVPFVTSPSPGVTYSGVFFTGDRPNWILGTDKGGVKVFPSGHALVHAFTSCKLWDGGDFLVYSEDGPCLLSWLPDFQFDCPLPYRSIARGRSYSHVMFDPSTSLIVAASSLKAKFTSYDEDNVRVWEPDAPNVTDPSSACSSLELISPDAWITLDGYVFEFTNNEYVNDLACISLETASTESGSKDFIVVGTTIDRGEDLAARGATYIFEIVDVVPDPAVSSKRWYKLRLRCRDDAKGPVTAVCGFSGYLVSSMGQKIFVRAFDADERLVGVAFLDVGVYVTSLRSLKNLLLVGDAVKSVTFVAFQEDPYKLVTLAKDNKHISVTAVDFFFSSGELAIITGDEDGIIRVYDYNPQDPDSNDGRYLLLRTEFHGQYEYRTSTVIARRKKDDQDIPQSKLIMGSPDGSLTSLTPVDESSFKRLLLLQGQLTRNIQHVAGLNPKAFRIVRNDYISKPLSKGILDGSLLAHYEALPFPRQSEMTRQIGTDRLTLLRDWTGLTGPW
ncbi:CPSF A subunit region-domain-containing protein [Panaeolus papilionaceus]|nr:CPSF A subunit region-domain-containing protein [Panaeolus papilionaceus]